MKRLTGFQGDILDLLSQKRVCWTVLELTAITGVDMQDVHDCLQVLAGKGYVSSCMLFNRNIGFSHIAYYAIKWRSRK